MQNKKLLNLLTAVFLVILISNCFSQNKKLTYQQVYRGGEPNLYGQTVRVSGWLDDSHYLQMKTETEGEKRTQKLLKVNAETGETKVHFDYNAYDEYLKKGFSLSRPAARSSDYKVFIFNVKNDLYCFSTNTKKLKRLTSNSSSEKNPRLSPDAKKVAFTRDNNLFVIDLESGLEHQLTNDGSDVVYNGWASWVYYEEILGRGSRYRAFWWSPSSDKIAFLRFDDSKVPEFHLYKADGVRGELETARYPKPGDPNPQVKLGIVHLNENKTVWVNAQGNSKEYLAGVFWTPDSKRLFFQWMNRGQDNIKIYSANPETGKKTEIYDEKQNSWVDWFTDIHFLKNEGGFILRSDKDGWAHLYNYDMAGHLRSRITKGNWRVSSVELVDEENNKIFFRRTLGNSLETHLYVATLKGKKMKRLTKQQGSHRCSVSPGGTYFTDSFSNIQQPNRMDLYRTNGELIRNIYDRTTPLLGEYNLGTVELFTIPSGDGFDLPAVWVLPPDFDQSKKYPVLFQIYGGPAAASVSNSYRRLSWYYLAQNGIIVMAVDHRGSGHFGKKGEALMHRNLGKWEMFDYIAAAKWLKEKPFVNPEKIGMTGGSYGGYATLMALTYGADYFTHGIANSSVTDWHLYDTHYTERYMDTPEENPEGYKFGSVMTHAEKLKGQLLITHGTMDDNVHMQNIIQLIEKFQELDKDFELMIYPNSRHGVGGKKRAHVIRESVQFWFKHFLGRKLNPEID